MLGGGSGLGSRRAAPSLLLLLPLLPGEAVGLQLLRLDLVLRPFLVAYVGLQHCRTLVVEDPEAIYLLLLSQMGCKPVEGPRPGLMSTMTILRTAWYSPKSSMSSITMSAASASGSALT